MFPTLAEGATVFLRETSSAPEGSVVVVEHPRRSGLQIVKRLSFVDGNGLFVVSDNREAADAQDSQTFGPVPLDKLVGVVTSQLG